jgi:7-cyano-7-deazaguanine synthase
MPAKSLVLLSGGLDSMYALTVARRESDIRLVVTFDYGQRSHEREAAAARAACRRYGIPHRVVALPFLDSGLLAGHPLFDARIDCPAPLNAELDDAVKSAATAKAVWVPNRNGIFLNVAAGLAEALGAEFLYVGFNAEEGATFPDNSVEYVDAVNKSLFYSTQNRVHVVSPPLKLRKTDIVRELKAADFDFSSLWSCYLGGEKMCGACESCARLKRALRANGLERPDLFL